MRRIFSFSIFAVCLFLQSSNAFSQSPIKISTGVCLGGAGLFGIPIQFKISEFISCDVGLYFRAVRVSEFEKRSFFGPGADASLSVYMPNRNNKDKTKTTRHGLYFKLGYGLHNKAEYDFQRIEESMGGIGWLIEFNNISKPNKFLQLQVGPSLIHQGENFLNTRYPPGQQLQTSDRYMPMIYARLAWFFSLNKNI